MTEGSFGFSLALRAAPIAASTRQALICALICLVATLAMPSGGYALDDTVIVTNQSSPLAGSISTFPANSDKAMNIKPSAVISGTCLKANGPDCVSASINFFGALVPALDVLTAVHVNPTAGPGAVNTTYALSDLSLLGTPAAPAPDVLSVWAPGATGNLTALAGTITLAMGGVPLVPLSLPQDVDFALKATPGLGGEAVAVGDVFVSNYTGGGTVPPSTVPLGSVIHFPPTVGTAANPLGLIVNPFGPKPPEIPALVLQDSVLSATNPFGCSKGVSTHLLGPVGVKLDAKNDIWVVNSGFRGALPSYITEYAPGSFGCTPPINVIGLGKLVSGGYLAIDPDGDLWVTDLTQNAVFEFSPKGAVLTTIQGKRTGLRSPMGIALGVVSKTEPTPNVYVANNQGGNILEYENADDGGLLNIKTEGRIQGGKAGINGPVGVAVFP